MSHVRDFPIFIAFSNTGLSSKITKVNRKIGGCSRFHNVIAISNVLDFVTGFSKLNYSQTTKQVGALHYVLT